MSQVTPRITGAETRQILIPFWALSTTVLSSALFVLVGISAQSAFRGLDSTSMFRALVDVLVVTAVVIGVRWVWLYTTPYLIRLLDRRPSQRLRRVPARQRTVSAVSGFRGSVSLAAVLAVPHTLDSGAPFPDRDLMVLITCGVILLTLLQALLLPAVVRFARLPVDTSVAEELQFADEYTLDAAIEALDTTADELGSGETVVARCVTSWTSSASWWWPAVRRATPSSSTTTSTRASPSLSSAGGERRSWSCATSSASTTSCCAGCRLASTSRRCGSCVRTRSSEACRCASSEASDVRSVTALLRRTSTEI